MDEARRVLDRLDRIERLRGAPAGDLLAEVRALLAEGEAWLRSDPGAAEATRGALGRLRDALERGETGAMDAKRTLVA